MRLAAVGLVAVVGLFSGCGGSSSTGAESTAAKPFRITSKESPLREEKELKLKPSGLAGPEPKPIFPNAPPPEFLALTDLIEGIGVEAYAGKKVTVQYVGYDYETRKRFASSWQQGRPLTFTLGAGEVIPAWEEGIENMEVGDRREMVVPPDLTKGAVPPGIPAGKTVIFVVETLPASSAAKAIKASSLRRGGGA